MTGNEAERWFGISKTRRGIKDKMQKAMMHFLAEAKMIEGAEGAIFELSGEVRDCITLSGEIYGEDTQERIHKLGRKYGFLILADELSILFEKPKGRSGLKKSE